MDKSLIGTSINTGSRSGWYHDSCLRNGDYIIREYILDCSVYIWKECLKGRINAVRWTDNSQPVVIDCAYNLNGLADYCADMLRRTFTFHTI